MKLKVQNFSSTPNIHIHFVIFILVVSIPRIRLRTKDTKIVKQHKAKSTEFFFSRLISTLSCYFYFTHTFVYIFLLLLLYSCISIK